MDIAGQRVVITGGTRGIGLALARAFHSLGATVAVCGRQASRPDGLAGLDGVAYLAADLARVEALTDLADRMREALGDGPTVLINNAGVQYNHDWAATDVDARRERAVLEATVNLVAPVALTALFLDDLLAAPEAAVVNVTSTLALAPKASAPVYCATKAGLRSFTQGLRLQLANRPDVKVIEVLPPLVDTGMTAGRGTGKMSPADLAAVVVAGIESGEDEIWVGKARMLRLLNRLAPGTVRRILARG